jgi:DNA ligase D-like protein (predicted polymerase)
MASPFVELEVGERIVKLSNPDKVLFPAAGHTKRDLAEYYVAVGDGIVRALRERPTQLRRFPDGIDGEAIYQKRVPEKRPDWIEVARVRFPSGRHADELCVTELAQVIWAANLATIDFHPWPSRRADTEHPDELRIDIDPQPGTDLADGKQVAAVVREVLGEIGYVGWPKTSGNRGIHVACRIEPKWEFPVVRRCALAFAREIERRRPDIVTTAWWKEERGAKVFIDYNQNARDRTIASAYSVRARADAAVSAPVTWNELPDVETEDFTLASMPARFVALGDLNAGIDDAVCDLGVLLDWVQREEAAGVGEAPYPPNFPKMPGEPPRVQPSRARPRERPPDA